MEVEGDDTLVQAFLNADQVTGRGLQTLFNIAQAGDVSSMFVQIPPQESKGVARA